jgi:hypothetical protein
MYLTAHVYVFALRRVYIYNIGVYIRIYTLKVYIRFRFSCTGYSSYKLAALYQYVLSVRTVQLRYLRCPGRARVARDGCVGD